MTESLQVKLQMIQSIPRKSIDLVTPEKTIDAQVRPGNIADDEVSPEETSQ